MFEKFSDVPESNKPPFFIACLTLALYFSGLFVFLTPLPFIYLIFKRGIGAFYTPALLSLSSVAGVYIFGLSFFSTLYLKHPALVWILPIPGLGLTEYFSTHTVVTIGIGYFLFYMAISVLVVQALSRPELVFRRMLWSVLGIFLVCAGLNAALVWPQTDNLISEYRKYMIGGMEQIIAMQDQAGGDSVELIYLKTHIDDLVQYTLYLVPSFLLSTIIFLYVLNLVLAKRLFLIFFPKLAQVRLTAFKMPFACVWIMVGLISVFLFNYQFVDNLALHFLALNVFIAIGTAYFFQGFAIFVHFLDTRRIFGFMRVSLYFLIFLFMQAAMLFLVALGFFDSWMDIRKLEKPVLKS